MGTTDEIKRMQEEGMSEQEIGETLRKRGVSEREVSNAMSQAKIKAAVGSADEQPVQGFSDAQSASSAGMVPSQQEQQETEYSGQQGDYSEMQPSMLGQEQEMQEAGYPGQMQQDYGAAPDAYGAYPQYQPYQEAMSSDLITEISEQVVNEKLSIMQDRLENAIDFRTVAESRISSLNERLKRIEQIIDKLQVSVLQKVGEYMTNVGDLKQELRETQKSFTALHKKGHGKHRKHP